MRISEANKLIGKIMKIDSGHDMVEVIVDIGDFAVTATVSQGAARDMNLHEGDEVFTMFNSTDVTLIKDTKHPRRDYGV
ncbi:MAG: TOBE domain-containing protein [Syntrophomonadaceae bacterium]|nr:TOBE domain-containing protein [Syntrophomonadaceae bacterium]